MAKNWGRLSLLVGATLAFWSTLPTSAPAQTVSFTATAFTVGDRPQSVAVGDFNGDGRQDLAVANQGSSTVTVLLGNGDGTFRTGQDIRVDICFQCLGGARLVAVGDFNGDGVQDLVVVAGHSIEVLRGNGDGTFQAPSLASGFFFEFPSSLAVGDFNGDGVQDLAVGESARNPGLVVQFGNGDGTFSFGARVLSPLQPTSLAVGDFNGDEVADLAAVGSGRDSNNVRVLLSNGDGTFQAARTFEVGCHPTAVAAADLNGDGTLDLAMATRVPDPDVPDSDKCSVLLGNGDGAFRAAQPFGAGTAPAAIAVGDFNRDRVPDLAVANAGSNDVSVLLGNGDGTFQAAQNFEVGTSPFAIAVGDFNEHLPRGFAVHRKEAQDVVVANSYSNSVSVLINVTHRGAPNGPVD